MHNQITKSSEDKPPRRTKYFVLKVPHRDGGKTPVAVCNGGVGFVPRRPICGGRQVYKFHVLAKVVPTVILEWLAELPRTGAAVIYARDQEIYDQLAEWFGRQDGWSSA
jgi:hypothetical protein